jgi:ElaB/YqjD/DUF883 family membrane-anchored ribosome-binding protein
LHPPSIEQESTMTINDTAATANDLPDDEAIKPIPGAALADRMDRRLDSATESIRKVQSTVNNARTQVRQQVREVSESSVDYIRQNPWQAISISAGIGLLVGVLCGRR